MAIDISTQLQILIEIPSAKNLMIGDVKSSDPYVIAVIGKDEVVHKTGHVTKK